MEKKEKKVVITSCSRLSHWTESTKVSAQNKDDLNRRMVVDKNESITFWELILGI